MQFFTWFIKFLQDLNYPIVFFLGKLEFLLHILKLLHFLLDRFLTLFFGLFLEQLSVFLFIYRWKLLLIVLLYIRYNILWNFSLFYLLAVVKIPLPTNLLELLDSLCIKLFLFTATSLFSSLELRWVRVSLSWVDILNHLINKY